jgi:hypothetical protein
MTENVDQEHMENAELICPITLQLFLDPVKATDGHVYERDAITRWILQHGTSPFTRQPLQISDFIPDDYLRNLSRQRRSSRVSYNAQNDTVTFSSFEYPSINNRQINPSINNPIVINVQIRDYSKKIVPLIILISFIFPVSLITGIVVGLKNSFSQGN